MSTSYLAPGLPQPMPGELDAPYWQGLQDERLLLQRCTSCQHWQWGPEWICHRCHSDKLVFEQVDAQGEIYSYERVWHPVHPALAAQGPYIVALVELPQADGVRLVGNLLGPGEQEVTIGSRVDGFFEHHPQADTPFTLLHWQLSE